MTEVEISNYLNKKGIFAKVGGSEVGGLCVFEVSIELGDWKHDHLYCDYLMEELGYKCVKENVTEEDGSDCYSAIHYYIYTGKNN